MATSYIYCFIRKDIDFTYQIIQMAHAAYDAGRDLSMGNKPPHLVLFEVENSTELLKASEHLENNRIAYRMFYEPDYGTGFTSICSMPVHKPAQRAVFKDFKLYKYEPERQVEAPLPKPSLPYS